MPDLRTPKDFSLRKALVCFADILGWTNSIREAAHAGASQSHLNAVRQVIHEIYDEFRRGMANGNSDEMPSFQVQFFSDNIVAAFYLRDGEPMFVGEFGRMILVFGQLQMALARRGLLLRGGVALGDFYMDQDFACGTALFDAVESRKTGRAPEIWFHRSMGLILQRIADSFSGPAERMPWSSDLMVADGQPFLNYLQLSFIGMPQAGIFFELIEDHKRVIEIGLAKFAGDLSVRSKYEWLAGYHNFFCSEFHPIPTIHEDMYPEDAYAAEDIAKLRDFRIAPLDFPSPKRISNEALAAFR